MEGTISTYTGDGTNGTNGTVYKVHTFTSSGNFVTTGSKSYDYIVVAGGGSGGPRHSGGGGAGGYIAQTEMLIYLRTHAIVIGAGRAGISAGTGTAGNNGSNTTFNSHTAIGGGGGGYSNTGAAGNGGSGGGGSSWNAYTQVPVHQVKDTQEVQDIGRPPETIEFLVEGAELLKSVNLEIILELYTVMEEMEYKII